jgi:hypothetical protein
MGGLALQREECRTPRLGRRPDGVCVLIGSIINLRGGQRNAQARDPAEAAV